MRNIRIFLSENFLGVKFSIYLNRRVFVMRFAQSEPDLRVLPVYTSSISKTLYQTYAHYAFIPFIVFLLL